MRLVDTAIKRPVSVIVGVLFVALFGLISLFRIPVQLTPDVDRPLVTVSTVWPGASPKKSSKRSSSAKRNSSKASRDWC